MKAVTGAVAAVLTIVLVFFGLGLRGTPASEARPAAAGQAVYAQAAPDGRMPSVGGAAAPMAIPVSATQYDGGWQAMQQPAAQQPMLINCGPGSQALVRTAWLNGQQVSQVECLASGSGAVAPQQVRRVSYDEGVYDARITRRQATGYTGYTERRVTRPHRSWQKTALVIGGTTAAGAGIGGLIGGKKGALIGAAMGGGGSTIYEAMKRH